MPPPPQETTPLSPGPDVPAPGPVHLVVLGPASRGPEAAATMFLTPVALPPAPAGPRTGVAAQHPRAGLGAALGALQRRVRRLQRRHARHRAQLQALEQLAQQLRGERLVARARRGLARGVSAAVRGSLETKGRCRESRTRPPCFQISGFSGKKSVWRCQAATGRS